MWITLVDFLSLSIFGTSRRPKEDHRIVLTQSGYVLNSLSTPWSSLKCLVIQNTAPAVPNTLAARINAKFMTSNMRLRRAMSKYPTDLDQSRKIRHLRLNKNSANAYI